MGHVLMDCRYIYSIARIVQFYFHIEFCVCYCNMLVLCGRFIFHFLLHGMILPFENTRFFSVIQTGDFYFVVLDRAENKLKPLAYCQMPT